MPKILIVEDDLAVRDVVEYALSREGMETEAVSSGEAATERLFSGSPFDLVILDVMLPDTDGVTLCRELRASDCALRDVPVVMLTARDDETSVVVGLEVGADDYVTKPFSPRQLVSRVRAHLRRRGLNARGPEHRLEFPGLTIDLVRRKVLAGERPVELTSREFEVLTLLASYPGRGYGRGQNIGPPWGGGFFRE